MSIQHRPADHPTDSPSECRTRAASTRTESTPPRTDPQPALADRVERTQLRAQVAALERSLAESERRRQAIVDQYELILDDRADGAHEPTDDHDPRESESDADGPVARLQRLLPVVG